MNRFEGKKCLVTAAGQGIGAAIARRIVAEGGTVIATDINETTLATLASEIGCTTAQLDVLDKQRISEFINQNSPFDVVANCAGFVHHGTILECSDEDWDFSVNINIGAMFRVLRAALPAMIENGGGSIVNVSSVVSSITGAANRFVYGTTKAGVIGLTKSIARDYTANGVRCNAICPGTVDSPSLTARLTATGDYDAALAAFTDRQPMGRIGTPDEIAAMAAYLASDDANYTTGQAFVVDGGWTL